jgi:hypothetical protein
VETETLRQNHERAPIPSPDRCKAMFETIFHADWSCEPGKRWAATALRTSGGWSVSAPQRIDSSANVLGLIHKAQHRGRNALFGFDFPIGLPLAYGKQTNFTGFVEALSQFGFREWDRFFDVADHPDEISITRPFYPQSPGVGRKHAHMFEPLNVNSIDDLRRFCERKTPHRPAACPLFWTLGGNQVGKAAGSLQYLSRSNGCVICETYPREAYNHLGISFRTNESKKKQEHRKRVLTNISSWAEERAIAFTPTAKAQVIDGFGQSKSGEDAFDAFVGLLAMIEVIENRRPEQSTFAPREVTIWEGWILGQVLSDEP